MLDWPAGRGVVWVSAVLELGSTEGGGTVETAVKAETGVVGVITVVDVGG